MRTIGIIERSPLTLLKVHPILPSSVAQGARHASIRSFEAAIKDRSSRLSCFWRSKSLGMCQRGVNPTPHCPGRWVNTVDRMGLRVDKVVADKMVMVTDEDVPVEIMQTEETRKEKSTPPEGIWDPSVEIVVVPRR
jgi:hypothetical protein